MTLNLSKKDCCIIYGSLGVHLEAVSNLVFYGGEVGSSAEIIEACLRDLLDRVWDAIICEADDEANSPAMTEIGSKRTASNQDQRSVGDEVSLDQHVRLYQEVFNG